MTCKIVSPSGASVIKTLSEEEIAKIKALNYYQVVPLTVHRKPFVECESCSA